MAFTDGIDQKSDENQKPDERGPSDLFGRCGDECHPEHVQCEGDQKSRDHMLHGSSEMTCIGLTIKLCQKLLHCFSIRYYSIKLFSFLHISLLRFYFTTIATDAFLPHSSLRLISFPWMVRI